MLIKKLSWLSVLCTIVCTFMGPQETNRNIHTSRSYIHILPYCSLYKSVYLSICMYVWNILCLLTGGTRPKYWSRFSGAQCQNGNNANSIIIILIGAQTEAGVSRMEYYIIYVYTDTYSIAVIMRCWRVSGKMAQGSVCRNVNSLVCNTIPYMIYSSEFLEKFVKD